MRFCLLVSYRPLANLRAELKKASFCDVQQQSCDNAATALRKHSQGPQRIMFGGFDPLRHDAWRGLRRDEDDIRAAEMGPSAAVYVNRFGGDVRTFGKLLPDPSRKIADACAPPAGAERRRCDPAARRVPTIGNSHTSS